MKKGSTYTSLREIPAYDSQDDDCRIAAGIKLMALSHEKVADVLTGDTFRLPRLQATNPSWYFSTGFNFKQPSVALCELAFETVRCNEGLQVDLLFAIAVDACPRSVPTYNSFTAALSADKRISMRDQAGNPVKGLNHNKRFCTYHMKRSAQPVMR